MRFPTSAIRAIAQLDKANRLQQVQWEGSIADPEIPGRRTYIAATTILARKFGRITDLGGDRVSNLTVYVGPEATVKVNDRLDGANVIEVIERLAPDGTRIGWKCYARA